LYSHSIHFQNVMEPEGLIPNPQELFTVPILSQKKPDHITPSHLSILILSTQLRPGLPNALFPFGFLTNKLYALLFSRIRAASILSLSLSLHTHTHTHTQTCICLGFVRSFRGEHFQIHYSTFTNGANQKASPNVATSGFMADLGTSGRGLPWYPDVKAGGRTKG
jgi:hypothetical protein